MMGGWGNVSVVSVWTVKTSTYSLGAIIDEWFASLDRTSMLNALTKMPTSVKSVVQTTRGISHGMT